MSAVLTHRSRPAVRLRDAQLAYGDRVLWSGIDMDVAHGQFVTILGPNGSGKTSLLRALLGVTPLSRGTVAVNGRPVRRGDRRVGYIPQHRGYDPTSHCAPAIWCGWASTDTGGGPPLPNRVREARSTSCSPRSAPPHMRTWRWASSPVENSSGCASRRRWRTTPRCCSATSRCCHSISTISGPWSELIDERRRAHGTAVLFVTHEINPVLAMIDRVLYLTDGRFRLGTPTRS